MTINDNNNILKLRFEDFFFKFHKLYSANFIMILLNFSGANSDRPVAEVQVDCQRIFSFVLLCLFCCFWFVYFACYFETPNTNSNF